MAQLQPRTHNGSGRTKALHALQGESRQRRALGIAATAVQAVGLGLSVVFLGLSIKKANNHGFEE